MLTCPVCDNQQPSGEECEVCGRPFARGLAVPAPPDPVPGLEPTRFEAVAAGDDRLDGLEPTALSPVEADAASLPAVELEPTRMAPVDAPATEAVAGLEPTLQDGPPLPAPGPTTTATQVCRYCRTPAPPTDAWCSRCGMRLPGMAGRGARGAPVTDGATALCFDCGTPMRGAACPSCGSKRA